MQPWWERHRARYDHELAVLDAAGYDYAIDQDALARGQLALDVAYPYYGCALNLRVLFPDNYPYFPFAVRCHDLDLPHHQDPISKTLCLFGGDSERWHCKSDTLAGVLDRAEGQMGKLLDVTAAPEATTGAEQDEDAEPLTAYLRYRADSYIGFGDCPLPAHASSGTFNLGLDVIDPLRGAVLAVHDAHGAFVAEAEHPLPELYSKHTHIQGRWVRLPSAPRTDVAERWLDALVAENPSLAKPRWTLVIDNQHVRLSVEVLAAVFADELRYGEEGENWVFVVRLRRQPPRARKKGGQQSQQQRGTNAYLARPGHESRGVVQARVPELRPLQDKTVAVVGLGSLGSVSAVELARAGVGRLRLLDRDLLEFGNSVRWALGRSGVGSAKAHVLAGFVRANHPYTEVTGLAAPLGDANHTAQVAQNESPAELKLLDELLEGADLVLDASAEMSVGHLLSDLCAERGIPYAWVTTTPGAWGGLTGRVVPGRTGCWHCFKHHQTDGGIRSPNFSDTDNVQPAGCLHATFTGAAVDINQIALAAVRLAISTLCEGNEGAYPRTEWDVATINLRDATGGLIPPDWQVAQLTPHSACCGRP